MELELDPEPFEPLIDELADALESGRVTVIGATDDDEPWVSFSCVIVRDDDGYAITELRTSVPIRNTEGWETIRLDESLTKLLDYCEQRGMSQPRQIWLHFHREWSADFAAGISADDGTECECELLSAEEPLLRRLFERWGLGVAASQAGQYRVRDPRAWWGEVNEHAEFLSSNVQESRDMVNELIESDPHDEWAESDFRARRIEQDTLDDHIRLFGEHYLRGDKFSELRSFVDCWYEDFTRVFALLERRAGTPAFTKPPEGGSWVTVWHTVNLIMVATLLGKMDIVRDVLRHPAISHAPYRAVDVLALVNDVPQVNGIDDLRADGWQDWVVHERWLKVTGATPGRRQAAFEKFVREWQEKEGNKRVGQVKWCITGAYLAVALGLDDSAVRDLETYPSELADFARASGVQSIPAKMKLAGPWKKPTPPKVLEPAEARQPHAFSSESGELALADFAALLTPVSAEQLTGSFDELLESAVDAGTVAMLNWKGVALDGDVALIQDAGRALGLRVPGRNPTKMPKATEKALPRFDEWLEPLGVRLLELDIDSDDVFVLPVLAEDYDRAVGRTVGDCTLRATGSVPAH
ncbi:hypothetical protein [Microbacterium sp. MPKO10]|uniref:DUF6630 family protein n=1 Tax=Microbacterium sp. MPKO10 TaxID=2989818 RepID=UPI002235E340|nr:hypothetical protein [Microbacterium sp. MPKO10]MCW4457355.1 hypothetical protein [Microbacterium sp. MPKO10]